MSAGFVPLAFMIQMSALFVKLTKAIFEPSGDHAGSEASIPGSVRSVWFEPSASITKIFEFPLPRLLTNAILVPSGDQEGCWLACDRSPARFVSWVTFEPSPFIV